MSIVISILAICGGPVLFFGIVWYLAFSTRVKLPSGRRISIQEMLTEIKSALVGFTDAGIALILDPDETRLADVTAALVAAQKTGNTVGLSITDLVVIVEIHETARFLERHFGCEKASIVFCGLGACRDGDRSLRDMIAKRHRQKLADTLSEIELGRWKSEMKVF